jgi:hypothetical protein
MGGSSRFKLMLLNFRTIDGKGILTVAEQRARRNVIPILVIAVLQPILRVVPQGIRNAIGQWAFLSVKTPSHIRAIGLQLFGQHGI